MSSNSFLALAIDDPRIECGAVIAGLGGVLWWRETPEVVVIPLTLAGLVLLLFGGWHVLVSARIAREGRDAVAQVADVRHSWPYWVRYAFRDRHGHEVTGRRFLSQSDALHWRRGDPGSVRYDPEDSGKNIWLARSDDALLAILEKPVAALDAGDKLALAQDALGVGHRDYARELLDEVAKQGTGEQKELARRLIEGRQLAETRPESRAAAEPAVAPAPITRAMLKRGAGELYDTTIVIAVVLVALLMLAGYQKVVPPMVFFGVGAIAGLSAYAVHLFRIARRNAQRLRKVLEKGIVAEGSVLAINEVKTRAGGAFHMSLGWDISYSYLDRRARLQMGESGRLSREEAMRYRVGDRCEVVFDPDEPESSFWVSRDRPAAAPVRRPAEEKPAPSSKALSTGIVVAILAVCVTIIAVEFWDRVRDQWFGEEAPGLFWRDAAVELRPITSLKGISLGQHIAEASGRHGRFTPVAKDGPSAGPPDEQEFSAGRVTVSTKKAIVTGVSYECDERDATSVNRVACGAPAERIRAVFGAAPRKLCAKVHADNPDKAMRELAPHVNAFDILQTGTRFVVIRDRVAVFIVREPRDLESQVGDLWHECGR